MDLSDLFYLAIVYDRPIVFLIKKNTYLYISLQWWQMLQLIQQQRFQKLKEQTTFCMTSEF